MTVGDYNGRPVDTTSVNDTLDPVPAVAGSDRPTTLTQAAVERLGEDVLCGLYLLVQDEVKATRDRLGLLEFEIRRRLASENATLIGSGKNELVLRPGAVRTAYLEDKLDELREHIRTALWDEIMRPHVELNVDKWALKNLQKRGGEIAAIIAEAIIETRSEGKLERVKQ